MIKRKIKPRKRKNPEIDIIKFLESLKPFESDIAVQEIGWGGYGETYIFKIEKNKVLNNGKVLKSGLYLIKRMFDSSKQFFNKDKYFESMSGEEIDYLYKLSKYGLIPKIYYIDQNFIIMKYIQSLRLLDYINKDTLTDSEKINIAKKLRHLISKWHELGFAHGDLSRKNVLITKNHNVYLIDPAFVNWNTLADRKESDHIMLNYLNLD